MRLDQLGAGRTVLYLYPLTGRADIDLPEGWDSIPGARGCTNEACDFRDHHVDLLAAGATAVYGLSTQTSAYQAELVERLRLPFAHALDLPTFATGGMTLYRRQTLVVRNGAIEHVFYPVFPPDQHASEVRAWLADHPSSRQFWPLIGSFRAGPQLVAPGGDQLSRPRRGRDWNPGGDCGVPERAARWS